MRRWAVLLAAALTLAGCAPRAATEQGRTIGDLWVLFLVAAAAVGAIVYGLILWSVVRYRRRSQELPPQFRQHLPLEALYTLIPVVLVVILFVFTFRAEQRVGRLSDRPAATVRVEAFDWSWRFSYPDAGVSVMGTPDAPPELVLPAGEAIRLILTSSDVIHAFYVPDFLFKRDAIPGLTNEFDLRIREPGTYQGLCAEFCGLDHARMRFTVRAVPRAEFDRWLAEQRETA